MLLDREEGHPKKFSCCDLLVRSKITNVVSEPYVLGRLGSLARADAIAARTADETLGLDEPRPQRHDRHAERFEVVGAVAREPVCAEIAAARLYCSPFDWIYMWDARVRPHAAETSANSKTRSFFEGLQIHVIFRG